MFHYPRLVLWGFRLQIIQLVFQLLFLNETLESCNHTTPGDEDFKGRIMVEKSLTPAGNQLNLVSCRFVSQSESPSHGV